MPVRIVRLGTRRAPFARRYRSEMRRPAARRLIASLAMLSSQADFSVGCYCQDESHCHRSLLRSLLVEAGATVAEHQSTGRRASGGSGTSD